MGKKLSYYVENFIPYIIAIISAVLTFIFRLDKILATNNFKDVVTSTINFIAITSGFFTTMLSILLTSPDRPIMKYLKSIKKMQLLFRYTAEPILVGFLDVIISLLLIPYCGVYEFIGVVEFYIFMVFTISFIVASIRTIIILLYIIKEFNSDKYYNDTDDGSDINYEKLFSDEEDDVNTM